MFSDNLKVLLLAAPAGNLATIGLDPGLRTGVKVAVIDANGKVLDHAKTALRASRKRSFSRSVPTLMRRKCGIA